MTDTPEPCGCVVKREYFDAGGVRVRRMGNGPDHIIYCPTHAAAPDLLAALKTVEEVLANARSAKGSYPNLLANVRAAIAKAKGESQERLDSTTRLGKAMVDATRLERNEAKRWDQ